jgi:hypothetical protein
MPTQSKSVFLEMKILLDFGFGQNVGLQNSAEIDVNNSYSDK